jgi:hypothetical protein
VHQDAPHVEPGEAPPEEHVDPPMAPEVAPTRLERLELERVARIAKAPQTRSECVQAYQAGLIDDIPSLGTVALVVVCEPASYLRAMRSPEQSKWEAAVNATDIHNMAFYGHSCTWGNGFWELRGNKVKGEKALFPFPSFSSSPNPFPQ